MLFFFRSLFTRAINKYASERNIPAQLLSHLRVPIYIHICVCVCMYIYIYIQYTMFFLFRSLHPPHQKIRKRKGHPGAAPLSFACLYVYTHMCVYAYIYVFIYLYIFLHMFVPFLCISLHPRDQQIRERTGHSGAAPVEPLRYVCICMCVYIYMCV